MKKLLKRLVIFFIGLPVLLSLVVFFPHYNHLLLNLVVIAFSVLGALEFRNILSCKNLIISLPETVILGVISPAAWTLVVSFGVTRHIASIFFILGASWILVSRIIKCRGEFDLYVGRTAAGFAVIIYPGLFMTWIVRMAAFSEADIVILVFLLVAILNDALAWAVGMLFGKNNRGFFAASPNKSIAGFIGGLAASLFTGIAAAMYFPGAFVPILIPSLPAGALLGLATGAAAILGDLSESALKRSAGVKDSGTLIMGRGGALDTIDSLAMAAPVFHIIYQVLF